MARNQISEYLTNNTIRTYYDLDKSMMKAHAEDRNEDAESTARLLLENLDLPLLLRARACMILGCGEAPDFLDMAKESVRVAELGFSLCEEPGELEKNLVEDCKKVLEEAQEAADQQEEDEENEDGMEIIWQAGEDQKEGEAEPKANTAEDKQPAKKTNVPRLITDPTKETRVGSSPPRMPRKSERRQDPEEEDSGEDTMKD